MPPTRLIFWSILNLLLLSGCSAQNQKTCYMDFAGYDPSGRRLAALQITKVVTQDGNLDLLLSHPGLPKITVQQDRLIFPEEATGAPIIATLRSPDGTYATVRQTVVCGQRVSVNVGSSDSGADVAYSIVEGKVSGCDFRGDWWVRAAPMFGTDDAAHSFESAVAPNGSFRILGSFLGVRHTLIVGKGSQLVKALAANLKIGGQNRIPTIDLQGACPK